MLNPSKRGHREKFAEEIKYQLQTHNHEDEIEKWQFMQRDIKWNNLINYSREYLRQ